jgi:predicted ATPase
VGRDTDLRALRSFVLSQDVGSAAITGPAGIGKTHLAAELAGEAEQRGFTVLRAFAGENATAFPFAALAPVLPPLGEQRDAAALLQQVRAQWQQDYAARPVLLVIDDCHQLDSGSAALVQQLVNSASCRLLATLRADQRVPAAIDGLWRSGALEIVDLEPFDTPALHDLLEEILGPPVSLQATQRLLRRTEGNPLFVREMVRAALVDESLSKSSGIWELLPGDTTSMRLADIVRRRIDSLGQLEMETLQLLAVAGAVSEADLGAILEDPPIEDLEERGADRPGP